MKSFLRFRVSRPGHFIQLWTGEADPLPVLRSCGSKPGGLFLDRSGADFLTDLYDTEAHDPVQYNLPLDILIREGQKTERLPIGFKKTLQKMPIIR